MGCIVADNRSEDIISQLTLLKNDANESVRIITAEALYKFGDTNAAVAILKTAIASENLMARVQALNVLPEMGDDALPALNAVKVLLPDDSNNYDIRLAIKLVADLKED